MACCSGVCDWAEELVDMEGVEEVAVRGAGRGAGVEDEEPAERQSLH